MTSTSKCSSMATVTADRRANSSHVLFAVVGVLVTGIIIYILADADDDPHRNTWLEVWRVTLTSAPYAAAWMLAAVGYGWIIVRLCRAPQLGFAIQLTIGIAGLLWLDVVLGMLGLLHSAGGVGGWLVLIGGWIASGWQLRRWSSQRPALLPLPHPLWWMAAPAIAVLIVACCSAPGWLWETEFGGYDALSYHLQLAREWTDIGRITPLEHNVYSHLPSYMEAAYTHLASLRGNDIDFVYACQFLHAMITIAAAAIVASLVRQITKQDVIAAIAGVVVIGTPWSIVVGSLAYNEMTVVLFLAAGLLAVARASAHDGDTDTRTAALIIGVFAASACGAKLTAIGFAAVPLLVAFVVMMPRTHLVKNAALMTLAGASVLSPWLISNLIHTGNPTFPFLTSIFSTGHWSAEQASTWSAGHAFDGGIIDRFREGWHQFLHYGIGPNPEPREPWVAQWSVLPWVALASFGIAVVRRSTRRWAVALALTFLVQLIFWLSFTHIKSRFMLPAVVPCTAIIALALHALIAGRTWHLAWSALAAVILLGWCMQPVAVFWREADGNPAAYVGLAATLTGDDLTAREREALASAWPAIYLNDQLPATARVLLVGDATPLFYQVDLAYSTTWDRGPLSQTMRKKRNDPAIWIEQLRQRGFTHVLVNPGMLQRWERSGWNDPLLTAERVMRALTDHAQIVHVFGEGASYLFEL